MQVKVPQRFQLHINNPERPELLSDLYFSRNPMHWQFEESGSKRISTQRLTIKDQFTRVEFRVDINNDVKTYSGGIYAGVGNPAQQEFSAQFSKEYFNRVNKQRSKWIKYGRDRLQEQSAHHDSPHREIEDFINVRAPTDWKLTTQKADAKRHKPKITTLTAGEGGVRVQLIKYHAASEDGQDIYCGKLSGAREVILDADSSRNYFEQIFKCGGKAIEVDLRHLVEYELESIFNSIPIESWLVSKRWLDSSDDPEEIGYSAICNAELMEGKNSFEFKIDISIDTRYDEQVIRLKLKRNGHKALISLPRDKHTEILNQLCAQFDLIPFHKESSASTPTTQSSRINDLILSS